MTYDDVDLEILSGKLRCYLAAERVLTREVVLDNLQWV